MCIRGSLDMKTAKIRSALGGLTLGTAMAVLVSGPASAVPTVYTDRANWEAAIMALDAAAIFRNETFNDETVTPDGPNGGLGTLDYGLGAGPHVYTEGSDSVSFTLNAVGNGGSQTGVVNPGANDSSNALAMRLSRDTDDFELFPGFTIEGEGIESADASFSTPQSVYGFAGLFASAVSHDGLQIDVNSTSILFNTHYPGSSGNDFLGIVDSDGITGFSLLLDNQDPSNEFEGFQLDNLEYAYASATVPMPEPGTVGLMLTPLAALWFVRRRASLRRR